MRREAVEKARFRKERAQLSFESKITEELFAKIRPTVILHPTYNAWCVHALVKPVLDLCDPDRECEIQYGYFPQSRIVEAINHLLRREDLPYTAEIPKSEEYADVDYSSTPALPKAEEEYIEIVIRLDVKRVESEYSYDDEFSRD